MKEKEKTESKTASRNQSFLVKFKKVFFFLQVYQYQHCYCCYYQQAQNDHKMHIISMLKYIKYEIYITIFKALWILGQKTLGCDVTTGTMNAQETRMLMAAFFTLKKCIASVDYS